MFLIAYEIEPVKLDEAREAVREDGGWEEVYHNSNSKVVSFVKGATRFNVYYTTGTVSTVLTHPTRGRTQLFRARVTLPLFERLLRNPRLHTGLGYFNNDGKHRVFERVLADNVVNVSDNEYGSLEAHVKSMNEEIERIQARRAPLIERMEEIKREREREEKEKRRRKLEAEQKAKADAELESRGREFTFYFQKDLHKELNQIIAREAVCLVANPNGGYFYSCLNGQSFWSGGLPEYADKALRTRIGEHCRPTIVAFGTGNRYYLQFANGKAVWSTPDMMDDALNKRVCSVAFGSDYNSYMVVFKNGTSEWCNVPTSLENFVKSRRSDLPKPDFISLGPNGEFFIRFRDGSWRSGGYDDGTRKTISNVSGNIRQVSFGESGVLVRYNR